MSNASLGLELEYFGFRVFLSAQGNQEEKIEEKDFKSKHIIVCDSEEGKKEEAKKLFSELGAYGIKVTLDSRSHQDYPSGEIPLTIELILNHEQFEIQKKEKQVDLSKPFSEYVDGFTQYITNLQEDGITLTVKFEENDKVYKLRIPKYKQTDKVLMPHVTIPCPVCKIGCSGQSSVEWQKETKESYTIPDYFVNYIKQIITFLKSDIQYPDGLEGSGKRLLELHDPKQNAPVIPKTSLKKIISIIRNKNISFCMEKEKNDVYITENLSYNQLIDNINSTDNTDLLKNSPLGIGSMGDVVETINDIECPIFEFRSIGFLKTDQMTTFEKELKKNLYTLLFDDGIPSGWHIF